MSEDIPDTNEFGSVDPASQSSKTDIVIEMNERHEPDT